MKPLYFFVLLTLFCRAFGVCAEGSIFNGLSYDEALELAEKSKITQHDAFIDTLAQLANIRQSLTPQQSLQLDYHMAYQLAYSNKRSEAVIAYEKILESPIDTEIKTYALRAIVYNLGYLNRWEEGLNYLEKLKPKINELTMHQRNTTVLAIVNFYNKLGEYGISLQHLNLLSSIEVTENDLCVSSMLRYEANLGSYIKGKKTPEQELIKNDVKLCEETNDKLAANYIRLYYANFLIKNNTPKIAIEWLQGYFERINSTQYAPLLALFYSTLADAHLATKNYVLAKEFALKLIENNIYADYSAPLVSAYRILYQIFEQEQDYQSAFAYFKQYEALNTIILNDEKTKKLAVQRVQQETLEKTNQIALLDKENALLDKQNTLLKTQAELAKEKTQNDRLFMALLSLVMVLIFLWAYKNRRMHKKLRKLAETDELTGIANRYHFSQLANAAISYCEKSRQPLSFILFDLDFFKKINDNFGHQVGDWALKQAVMAAQAVCRNNDVMGRLGGEEFGIILPGCAADKALLIAESCRLAIAAVDSAESGHTFKVTASFGVADTSCCAYEFDKLFAAADTALYQSKDLGRNRVYRYQDEQLTLAIQ